MTKETITPETLKLDNGYMLVIQTAENYHATGDGSDAEISIYNPSGELITNSWRKAIYDDVYDNVAGWCSKKDVSDAIDWAKSQSK